MYLHPVVLVWLLLLLATRPAPGKSADDLVSALNIQGPWRLDTSGQCNTASTQKPEQLYEIIDGGATLYLDNGFRRGVFAGYTNGNDRVCMELYDMAHPANALVLYNDPGFLDNGEYRRISALGDSARIDTSSQFAMIIDVVEGPFFLRFSVPSKEQILEKRAIDLIRTVFTRIKKH